MRTSALLPSLVALFASAPSALASLATLRGTIPGSLHQCEATNVFFFDSAAARPLSLVLLPAAVAPAAATVTLAEVLALGPLQVIDGITTPDAQQTNFVLAIAEGESFVTYAFLPDGSGKNLNLPRTVQAPLPGATACSPATAASAAAAVAPALASPTTVRITTTTTTKKARTTTTLAATAEEVAAAVTTSSTTTRARTSTSSTSSSTSAEESSSASSASSDVEASAAAVKAASTSGATSRIASGSVAGAMIGAALAVAAFAL